MALARLGKNAAKLPKELTKCKNLQEVLVIAKNDMKELTPKLKLKQTDEVLRSLGLEPRGQSQKGQVTRYVNLEGTIADLELERRKLENLNNQISKDISRAMRSLKGKRKSIENDDIKAEHFCALFRVFAEDGEPIITRSQLLKMKRAAKSLFENADVDYMFNKFEEGKMNDGMSFQDFLEGMKKFSTRKENFLLLWMKIQKPERKYSFSFQKVLNRAKKMRKNGMQGRSKMA